MHLITTYIVGESKTPPLLSDEFSKAIRTFLGGVITDGLTLPHDGSGLSNLGLRQLGKLIHNISGVNELHEIQLGLL